MLGNSHMNLRKNMDGREAGRMEGTKMKKKTRKKNVEGREAGRMEGTKMKKKRGTLGG